MKRVLPIAVLSLLLISCKEQVEVSSPDDTTIEYNVPMPSGGEFTDVEEGSEEWFAIGPMAGVGESKANGVAEGHVFETGVYRFTMQLNVERAPDGSFYEAWLVNPSTQDTVSAGHLSSHFGDVRHYLQYQTDKDMRDYTTVKVTLEADDGNPAPATPVAEGAIVHRKR